MAFRSRPIFKVVLVSTVSLLACLIDCLKFQDESKIGGSLVCVIPLCRFLNLPITVRVLPKAGIFSTNVQSKNKC